MNFAWRVLIAIGLGFGLVLLCTQAVVAEPAWKDVQKHPYFGKHPKAWAQVKAWIKSWSEVQWETPKPIDLSLRLPEVGGRIFSLASLRGHLILMTRWATWCEPCKAGLIKKKRLQQKLRPFSLQIVGIGYQRREEIVRYHQTQPPLVQFPISLIDEQGHTMDWIPGFEYPTTRIIDPWGWSWAVVYLRGNWDSPRYVQLFSHLLRWYTEYRVQKKQTPSTRPVGKNAHLHPLQSNTSRPVIKVNVRSK